MRYLPTKLGDFVRANVGTVNIPAPWSIWEMDCAIQKDDKMQKLFQRCPKAIDSHRLGLGISILGNLQMLQGSHFARTARPAFDQ